jgi:hypothetical protein
LSYPSETIDQSESSKLIKYVRISALSNPRRQTHEKSVHAKLHHNQTMGSKVILRKPSTNESPAGSLNMRGFRHPAIPGDKPMK